MAGTTGLEPATSAVTGQRSNQLSYVPKSKLLVFERLAVERALQPSGSGHLRPEFCPSPCHRSCHNPGTFLPLQHH